MAFLCDSPTVSHGSANETGGGGMQPLQIQGPYCLTGLAAVVRQRGEKKQRWINRQRAADNSVENTVPLFPAVCEFIKPHAVPLVISKYMQLI